MEEESREMKPCPFCGSAAVIIKTPLDEGCSLADIHCMNPLCAKARAQARAAEEQKEETNHWRAKHDTDMG